MYDTGTPRDVQLPRVRVRTCGLPLSSSMLATAKRRASGTFCTVRAMTPAGANPEGWAPR